MFEQRPGYLGALAGVLIVGVLLICFPTSIGGFIQNLGEHIPVGSPSITGPSIFFLGAGWFGYVIGMLGSLTSRTNFNWVMGSIFAIDAFVGVLLSYLSEFTFAQGVVFTVAILLFACWVFGATGSSLGPLMENRTVGLIVTIGFIVALILCFTDVARSGSVVPERPLSFLIVALLFFPYALQSMVELIWN